MGHIEMKRMIGFARGIFSNLIHDKRGSLATFVAAAALPLVAFTGLAVDTARGYLVKTRLNYALDSAALAGGRVMFDATARDAAIQDFFDANFPSGYMGATLTGPTTTVNTTDQTIKVEASANVGTTLMQVLGVDDVDVAAAAEVQRQVKGMELAMVLDITGSMRHTAPGSSQEKLEDLRDAATKLVDILYAGREEIDDFYMSIIPYTAQVNVGNQHTSWVNSFNAPDYLPTVWKGCVEARYNGPRDRNDDPPSVEKFNAGLWPTDKDYQTWQPGSLTWRPYRNNPWRPQGQSGGYTVDETNTEYGVGPNLNCGNPITPLVKARTNVDNAIAALKWWRYGGTMGSQGLVWGWRAISPRWRGLWDGDDPTVLPKDYLSDLLANSQPLSDKAVVMMTDGQNNIVYNNNHDDNGHYSSYGKPSWNRLGAADSETVTWDSIIRTKISEKMLDTCDLMKDKGIIIYTITFDTEGSSNQAIRDTYEDCATTPGHYFNSPGEDELTAAFIAIGTQLSNLRLAK